MSPQPDAGVVEAC